MVQREIFTGVLMLCFFPLYAQFSGHNLVEAQYGKLPSDTVKNFPTLYDRFVADYSIKRFKAGITLEQFYTPYSSRNYARLTQARLQYRSGPLEVKLGNFYETIGRGILLRSYEIPGALLEDVSYRSRHFFNRDIVGVNVKLRLKKFSVKLITGWPLNNVFPPNQPLENRRTDRIDAVYADYSIKKQTIGMAAMNLDNSSGQSQFGMFTVSGNILPFLSYYTEMAKNVSDFALNDFSAASPYAFYFNTNLAFGDIGVTAEYKNYNNFLLGAGINEPPALIKEQTYVLLNRSTHVSQPLNESGFQFEGYYNLPNGAMFTLNYSRAINDFGKLFVFQEYFGEYSGTIFRKNDLKLFVDFAHDPLKLEKSRFSTGAYVEWPLTKFSALNTDYEFQIFRRQGASVQNHFILIGYDFNSNLGFNAVCEVSTDPFIVENNYKAWLGANVKYKLNNKNTLLLFAGQRRGEPACNSGVCYEVLDFQGIELRVTSRL